MTEVAGIKMGSCAPEDAAGYQKVVQFPSVSAGASFFTADGNDAIACLVVAG